MKLEDQLSSLAELGLSLAPGRTVDELLRSFPREDYEREPFDLVLLLLGSEVAEAPWGRRFCDRVWHFDTECVYDEGAYVEIAEALCRLTGRMDALTDLRDHVDIEAGEAWLEYTVDGRRRHWDIKVEDDWVDATVVEAIMADLEYDGRRFYEVDQGQDKGQDLILLFADDDVAGRLNALRDKRLVVPVLEG